MSNPKYDQLIKDYPKALSRVRCGIYYPDGWGILINNLCSLVEQEINQLPPEQQEKVYVVQIKSKFGGLRYYLNSSTPYINGAVELAEALSFTTCEKCGNRGEGKQVGNWSVVLCEACHPIELDTKEKEKL